MKTVRFTRLVAKGGAPEEYLVLIEPSKDRLLQSAMRSQRILTVFQATVGSSADWGEVGFQPGRSRQYLMFPRTIGAFARSKVVGIKYELLNRRELPKRARALPPPPAKRAEPKRANAGVRKSRIAHPLASKIVEFNALEERDQESDEVSAIKKEIRNAMSVLESGKPVAAFNLLKRIVDE